jgi:hypothetical protein
LKAQYSFSLTSSVHVGIAPQIGDREYDEGVIVNPDAWRCYADSDGHESADCEGNTHHVTNKLTVTVVGRFMGLNFLSQDVADESTWS